MLRKSYTSSLIAVISVGLMMLGSYLLFSALGNANALSPALAYPTSTSAHVTSTLATAAHQSNTPAAFTPFTSATASPIVTRLFTSTPIVAQPTVTIVPTRVTALTPFPTSAQKNKVSWRSSRVSLEADDFYIIASGKKFLGPGNGIVGGDPGNPTYCSLELEWRENDVPMRLYIYFSADNQKWWSPLVRTRNGAPIDGWVSYGGKLFETPLGAVATGNYHLTSTSETDGTPNAAPRFSILHFENLRLQAFLNQ